MQKPDNYSFPTGPVIAEIETLVPYFPQSRDPKDEAIFFAYSQVRIAYVFLANLLQNKADAIGIYIYTWSIIDNAARLHNLLGTEDHGLRLVRNAFQHVDEKIDQYRNGIPVFGAITWICKLPGEQPSFHCFPKNIGRTFSVGVMKGVDPITLGVSHVTLSALTSRGRKDDSARQVTIRIDQLVVSLGTVVCGRFGRANPGLPLRDD